MKKRFSALIAAFCLCLCCISTAAAYTNNELCNMAKQHYKSLYGQEPPIVQVDRESGNEVVLHLYETTGGHSATWDWYTVDRNTGKGTTFMGEAIDLSPYATSAPTGSGLPFQDVKQSDSYYESIRYVYENGLFSGTSSTTFTPNGSMNRAMVATVLYRLAGSPVVSGNTDFQDVNKNNYYHSPVIWASARGIVTGTSNTAFSPQNPITHEQAAVMIYRYAVLYEGIDSTATASLSSYPDGSQVGAYAQKAMRWCITKGLITGNSLSPKSSATRAEVATMLYQLSKLPQGTGGYKQALQSFLGNRGKYSDYAPPDLSLYYDIDSDGVEELLSIYTTSTGAGEWEIRRGAVYTMRNGQPVRLIDDMTFYTASNPVVDLGVIQLNNNLYLCVHDGNSGAEIDEQHNTNYHGSYKLYSLSNAKLTQVQEVQYEMIGRTSFEPPFQGLSGTVSITANGQTQTTDRAGFNTWLNSWKWLSKISL